MNDFNQSEQSHEEFAEYKTMPMDFSSFVAQKMETKAKTNGEIPLFDPHKLMVNKMKIEKGEDVEIPPIVKWPDKEVKALEDFCAKNGIVGFNCGRMSPSAALAFLKTKLGIMDVPLAERTPYGYQMMGGEKKVLHG